MRLVLVALVLIPVLAHAAATTVDDWKLRRLPFSYDAISYSGNKNVHTPNLDSLARDGAWFTNGYSTTPTVILDRPVFRLHGCSAPQLGLQPWNHGMLGYGVVGYNYTYQMPSTMQSLGYHTAMVGKNHFFPPNDTHGYSSALLYDGLTEEIDDYDGWFARLLPQHDPLATGLSWNDLRAKPYVYPETMHPTTWTGENAVAFINTYNSTVPLFMKVSFHRPHSPYDPPLEWMKKYPQKDMPPPVRAKFLITTDWSAPFGVHYTHNPPCGAPGPNEWGWECWCGDFGLQQAASSKQGYYGSLSFMDYWLGEVVNAIKARGWYNDSLMLFISDHGDMQNDHFLWRKGYPWQASAHVPFIVTWPSRVPAGTHHTRPVELRDVFPTVLDAAGVVNASSMYKLDGVSVLPLAMGQENVTWREWIDLEHDIIYTDYIHWNALTDGKWKYVYMAMNGTEQLFNLTADPNEIYDLATEPNYASELSLWRQRLVEWLAPRGADWVANGQLVPRPQGMLYSPNYPGNPFAFPTTTAPSPREVLEY